MSWCQQLPETLRYLRLGDDLVLPCFCSSKRFDASLILVQIDECAGSEPCQAMARSEISDTFRKFSVRFATQTGDTCGADIDQTGVTQCPAVAQVCAAVRQQLPDRVAQPVVAPGRCRPDRTVTAGRCRRRAAAPPSSWPTLGSGRVYGSGRAGRAPNRTSAAPGADQRRRRAGALRTRLPGTVTRPKRRQS
jgi:hypothetical protein